MQISSSAWSAAERSATAAIDLIDGKLVTPVKAEIQLYQALKNSMSDVGEVVQFNVLSYYIFSCYVRDLEPETEDKLLVDLMANLEAKRAIWLKVTTMDLIPSEYKVSLTEPLERAFSDTQTRLRVSIGLWFMKETRQSIARELGLWMGKGKEEDCKLNLGRWK